MSCGRKIGPYDCCTIIEGDSFQLINSIPLGKIDAVLSDPPYGLSDKVELGFNDTQELVRRIVAELVPKLRAVAPLVMLTVGNQRTQWYPVADWIACWYKPGSMGRTATGKFTTWEPILIYGKPPMWNDVCMTSSDLAVKERLDIPHLTPKPFRVWKWLLEFAGETILDPFMGSGVTALTARSLGKHYLGFEIEHKYVELANKRLLDPSFPSKDEDLLSQLSGY
jgi:DNA modification methylase